MRELQCNRTLLMMALISGADVFMPAFELQDDSFNIHHDINQQKRYITFFNLPRPATATAAATATATTTTTTTATA